MPTSNSDEFDYSTLDTEARIVVQQRASEIKNLMRRTVQNIIEIGEKLTEAKAQLGYGNFTKWLEHEFEWQERSARNFMRVAEVFKTANFADLDFAASALYLLAAPSIPEQVRETAITLANQGETITYSRAKDIINEYKQSQQDSFTQNDDNIEADEAEAIATTIDASVSPITPTNQSPTVNIQKLLDGELEVKIAYTNVNLNLTGDRDKLISLLEAIQSDPSCTENILQQIKSQIDP